MNRTRTVVALLLAASCFDPLYELGPGRSWTVCCRAGGIDTCECVEGQSCAFQLTACAQNTCVEQGPCGGTGGGSGTGGGAGGGFVIQDAGQVSDAGAGGGSGGGGGGSGGGGQVVQPTTYEPCCTSGAIATCECPDGVCSAPPFLPCAMGACVGSELSCP